MQDILLYFKLKNKLLNKCSEGANERGKGLRENRRLPLVISVVGGGPELNPDVAAERSVRQPVHSSRVSPVVYPRLQ